jgi:hypothetical protein
MEGKVVNRALIWKNDETLGRRGWHSAYISEIPGFLGWGLCSLNEVYVGCPQNLQANTGISSNRPRPLLFKLIENQPSI